MQFTFLIHLSKGATNVKKKSGNSLIFAFLFSFVLFGQVSAATLTGAVSRAMNSLSVTKNAPGLLLLTDATYVKVEGACALPYLNQAQELTGCTVGKGNLLFFQRPQAHPLRLMLYRKDSGNAVVVSRVGQTWLSEALSLDAKTISTPEFWKKAKAFNAGKDLFSLAIIANTWAKNGPYDFLKSAELHNHIGPGLTSGYLIAHYILSRYPLKKGERYTVVACPVWCKEDAIQVILDCTPGKMGLIVKPLSHQQRSQVAVHRPAGLVLIWNGQKKSGRGAALSFDFDSLSALAPKNCHQVAAALATLDILDEPERFVSTAAEFKLNEERYQQIIQAGSNPYEVLGLLRKP
jgi:formylmethanofuran dehydrogenase subunit E-like metal-binding protein